jgi:hypothetical protein
MANSLPPYKPPSRGIGLGLPPIAPRLGFGLAPQVSAPAGFWLYDLLGTGYSFAAHPLWSNPEARNAVYGFGDRLGRIQYIGKADNLRSRLTAHQRRLEASQAGADTLYVHVPSRWALVPYLEVEKRLIEALCPPLNHQHNWAKSLFNS